MRAVQVALVGLALVCAYLVLWPCDVAPVPATTARPASDRGDAAASVSESGVPGAGLGAFASRTFAEGDLVGTYLCDVRPVCA